MAGRGYDSGWNMRNQRNQSYRNQPMTSSEIARGNQSAFIKGRTFQRSRPNFNAKPTNAVSTSNMSYGMGDQGFSHPNDRTPGPQFKRSFPYHQRNDNFSNMTSKSNTSYGPAGDSFYAIDSYWTDRESESAGTAVGFYDYPSSSREHTFSHPHQGNGNFSGTNTSYGMEGNSSNASDAFWTDGATGAMPSESAGMAVGFYDCPSGSREPPFSHPSENDPASLSNASRSMPQDAPVFFTGCSNSRPDLSRLPPSFRSSNPYSRHENFPSRPKEFSKFYPNQRNNKVIGTPYAALKDPTVTSSNDGQMERESDSGLHKMQELASELRRSETSKSERSRIMNAVNDLGLRSEVTTHKTEYGFKCHLFIHGIFIASGIAFKRLETARRSVFNAALHKLQMPCLRIIQTNPNSKELQASMEPNFINIPETSEESDPSCGSFGSRYKEYSRESLLTEDVNSLPLDRFIIYAPKHGLLERTAARTLKKSARINKMLLENEYFFYAESARCVVRLGNETLADEVGTTKAIAMNIASFQALMKLREFCWLIKNKPIENSDLWAVRKLLTRQDFGMNAVFHFNLKCELKNFVCAHTHEDILFDPTFRKDERILIHQMCRELGLICQSTTSAGKTYVNVRRPLEMLFDHLKFLGGESFSQELFPPGVEVPFDSPGSFHQEVLYDYDDYDDEQTGPPFGSQPSEGIPHFNRRKLRQHIRRNKYLNSSKKPGRNRRRDRRKPKQASATGQQN